MLRQEIRPLDGLMRAQVTDSNPTIKIAGVLVLLSLGGAAGVEWLWWALVLAGALLAIGLIARPWFAEQGTARVLACAAAVFIGAALVVSAIGAVIMSQVGMEPGWLRAAVEFVAIGSALALVALGVVVARRGRPSAGALLTASVPIGLAIDWGMANILPPGFFLAGAGYYVGMFLFGCSLIAIARPPVSLGAEGHR